MDQNYDLSTQRVHLDVKSINEQAALAASKDKTQTTKSNANNQRQKSQKAQRNIVVSLSYTPGQGLQVERTHHFMGSTTYEKPKTILGDEKQLVKEYIRLCAPLLVISNRVLNGHPVDQRRPLYVMRDGRPDKGEPMLDAKGKQMYSLSLLDQAVLDINSIIEDEVCAKALKDIATRIGALQKENIFKMDSLSNPNLLINRVENSSLRSNPSKAKGRGR